MNPINKDIMYTILIITKNGHKVNNTIFSVFENYLLFYGYQNFWFVLLQKILQFFRYPKIYRYLWIIIDIYDSPSSLFNINKSKKLYKFVSKNILNNIK